MIDGLVALIASDRPGRKASLLCRAAMIRKGADLLAGACRVAVVTGFFVPSASAPETDGPGGAAALARGIGIAGKDVSLWTDRFCLKTVRSASEAVGGPKARWACEASEILAWRPDLLVFIERLGRASDGRYYDMRGRDVTPYVVPLDRALDLAGERGIPSLAVGDGGNEAGMGILQDGLSELLPKYKKCLSVVRSDLAVPVDVSDWGGYGLAAALSAAAGCWCGVSGSEVKAMLEAQVASGAVDGVTLKRDLSVDGIPLEEHVKLAESIKDLFPCLRGSFSGTITPCGP